MENREDVLAEFGRAIRKLRKMQKRLRRLKACIFFEEFEHATLNQTLMKLEEFTKWLESTSFGQESKYV